MVSFLLSSVSLAGASKTNWPTNKQWNSSFVDEQKVVLYFFSFLVVAIQLSMTFENCNFLSLSLNIYQYKFAIPEAPSSSLRKTKQATVNCLSGHQEKRTEKGIKHHPSSAKTKQK